MHQKLPPPPPVRSGSPLIYIPGTEWILVFEGRTKGGKNWGGGAWDGTLLLYFLLSHFSKNRKNFPRKPLGVLIRVWETCFSPYHPARPVLIYLEILFWRIKNEYHSIKCFIKEYFSRYCLLLI